jgi:hypothetical protein
MKNIMNNRWYYCHCRCRSRVVFVWKDFEDFFGVCVFCLFCHDHMCVEQPKKILWLLLAIS